MVAVFKLLHVEVARKATNGYEKKKKVYNFCIFQKLEIKENVGQRLRAGAGARGAGARHGTRHNV